MTRRSFKNELGSLVFRFRIHVNSTNDPDEKNILDDFNLALQYHRLGRRRRFLIWGLLIGRSVDSFTRFFLTAKGVRIPGTFNRRIGRICSSANPLTGDPTIRNDLHTIRRMRNDLFHNSGRHFTHTEMRTFVFNSVKCITQLISDL